jgi:hypothetical protein
LFGLPLWSALKLGEPAIKGSEQPRYFYVAVDAALGPVSASKQAKTTPFRNLRGKVDFRDFRCALREGDAMCRSGDERL